MWCDINIIWSLLTSSAILQGNVNNKIQKLSCTVTGFEGYPTISHIKSCNRNPMTLCTCSYEKLHSSLFFWAALLALSKDFASMALFGPDHHGQTPGAQIYTWRIACHVKKGIKKTQSDMGPIPSVGCLNNAKQWHVGCCWCASMPFRLRLQSQPHHEHISWMHSTMSVACMHLSSKMDIPPYLGMSSQWKWM